MSNLSTPQSLSPKLSPRETEKTNEVNISTRMSRPELTPSMTSRNPPGSATIRVKSKAGLNFKNYRPVTLFEADESILSMQPSATFSDETRRRAKLTRKHLEEYYISLVSAHKQRELRLARFKDELKRGPLNAEQQQMALRRFYNTETSIVRSRRLDGRLSDFKMLKLLGRGAYGEVYLCRHKRTGEVVALKKLSKDAVAFKNQLTYVRNERDVLSGDKSSEWLVHLLYTFQDYAHIYLGMEYIAGGDVRYFLEQMGELEADEARTYFSEMLAAVDVLHRLGYIHRDLKPDNFLIAADGHLRLADFGLSKKGETASREPFMGQLPVVKVMPPSLARASSASASSRRRNKYRRDSMVGTPDYMAVEILRGDSYTSTVDFWALGIILFEMLTGYPPFNGETAHEVFQHVLNYETVLENPQSEAPDGGAYIDDECYSLIAALITEPDRRLGAKNGVADIQAHPWLRNVDWEHLSEQKPVFVPDLSGDDDTSYFGDAENLSDIDESSEHTFLEKFTRERAVVDAKANLSMTMQADSNTSALSMQRGASKDKEGGFLKSVLSVFNKLQRIQTTTVSGATSWISGGGIASGAGGSELVDRIMTLRDWRIVCSGARRVQYEHGRLVLREGEKNSNLYFVKSGEVSIIKRVRLSDDDDVGNEADIEAALMAKRHYTLDEVLDGSQCVLLGSLCAADWFGEHCCLNATRMGVDASRCEESVLVTSRQCELYVVPLDFLFSLLEHDAALCASFFFTLALQKCARLTDAVFERSVQGLLKESQRQPLARRRPSARITKELSHRVLSRTTNDVRSLATYKLPSAIGLPRMPRSRGPSTRSSASTRKRRSMSPTRNLNSLDKSSLQGVDRLSVKSSGSSRTHSRSLSKQASMAEMASGRATIGESGGGKYAQSLQNSARSASAGDMRSLSNMSSSGRTRSGTSTPPKSPRVRTPRSPPLSPQHSSGNNRSARSSLSAVSSVARAPRSPTRSRHSRSESRPESRPRSGSQGDGGDATLGPATAESASLSTIESVSYHESEPHMRLPAATSAPSVAAAGRGTPQAKTTPPIASQSVKSPVDASTGSASPQLSRTKRRKRAGSDGAARREREERRRSGGGGSAVQMAINGEIDSPVSTGSSDKVSSASSKSLKHGGDWRRGSSSDKMSKPSSRGSKQRKRRSRSFKPHSDGVGVAVGSAATDDSVDVKVRSGSGKQRRASSKGGSSRSTTAPPSNPDSPMSTRRHSSVDDSIGSDSGLLKKRRSHVDVPPLALAGSISEPSSPVLTPNSKAKKSPSTQTHSLPPSPLGGSPQESPSGKHHHHQHRHRHSPLHSPSSMSPKLKREKERDSSVSAIANSGHLGTDSTSVSMRVDEAPPSADALRASTVGEISHIGVAAAAMENATHHMYLSAVQRSPPRLLSPRGAVDAGMRLARSSFDRLSAAVKRRSDSFKGPLVDTTSDTETTDTEGNESKVHSSLAEKGGGGGGGRKSLSRAHSNPDLKVGGGGGKVTPMQSADLKVCRRFGLPVTECVLKRYACELHHGKRRSHGKIYLTDNFLCHGASLFGLEHNTVWEWVELQQVRDIADHDTKVLLMFTDGGTATIKFPSSSLASEARVIMSGILARQSESSASGSTRSGPVVRRRPSLKVTGAAKTGSERFELSQYDWDMLLKGAKCTTYQRDEVIVARGTQHRQLYQIGVGRCRVERDGVTLGHMSNLEMFGEITFLDPTQPGAAVSVIADEDDVEVHAIPKSYIDQLLEEGDEALAGRFYRFLAVVITQRIVQREMEVQLSQPINEDDVDDEMEARARRVSLANLGLGQ